MEPIASGVIADNARRVDEEGVFPRHTVEALANAGLLGLLTPEEHGGHGASPGAAAQVVDLKARMDRGRRVRLSRLGFSSDESDRLSGLHTRNFM